MTLTYDQLQPGKRYRATVVVEHVRYEAPLKLTMWTDATYEEIPAPFTVDREAVARVIDPEAFEDHVPGWRYELRTHALTLADLIIAMLNAAPPAPSSGEG
jgi:hypothetical protein